MNAESRSQSTGPRVPCSARTHAGAPCRGRALPGRPFCHFHDPVRAEALAASRTRGGAAPRRRFRRRLAPHQITHLLGELLLHALQNPDGIDVERLTHLNSLARIWFQSVRLPREPAPASSSPSALPIPARSRPAARLATEIEAALADLLPGTTTSLEECPAGSGHKDHALSPATDLPGHQQVPDTTRTRRLATEETAHPAGLEAVRAGVSPPLAAEPSGHPAGSRTRLEHDLQARAKTVSRRSPDQEASTGRRTGRQPEPYGRGASVHPPSRGRLRRR
jgi:hypothetical protein